MEGISEERTLEHRSYGQNDVTQECSGTHGLFFFLIFSGTQGLIIHVYDL